MRKLSITLVIFSFLFTCLAFAIKDEKVYLEGKIKSFTDKVVMVESGNSVWTVPREYVKHSDFKVDDQRR